MIDQPADRLYEVLVVDPRDILTAISRTSAQAAAYEPEERVEYASPIRAQHDGRAELHLPSPWSWSLVESPLPGFGDVDAEPPGFRDAGFRAAITTLLPPDVPADKATRVIGELTSLAMAISDAIQPPPLCELSQATARTPHEGRRPGGG